MKSAEQHRSLRRRADNTSGDRPLLEVERARLVRVPPRVLESGTVIANRFVLQARIGSGRYGEIYHASDRSSFDAAGSSKHVALLILRESLQKTDRLRRRIQEGFARLASWSHPNIVRILEFGRDESTFVAMELLEGESLRAILEDVGRQPLELEESLAVIRGVGEALRHAHARDIVHGDIRPETVFVTFEFRVKVLDFIPVQFKRPAALVDDSAADSSSKRRAHDDVYGLACLAYELLSGAHPYGGSLPNEAREAGLEPAPIAKLGAERWRGLRRALSLSAEQRTATIADFLSDIGITGEEQLLVAERPATRAAGRGADPPDLSAAPLRARAPVRGEKSSAARPVLLSILAIVLGAAVYLNYRDLRELAAGRMEDLAARVTAVVARPEATVESPVIAAAERPATEGLERPVEAVGSPLESLGPSVASEPEKAAAEGPSTPGAPQPGAAQPGAPQPGEEGAAAPLSGFGSDSPASSLGALAVDATTVTVSEAAAAARIAIRRTGDPSRAARVLWWTSNGSALSDEDYVDLGSRIETFEAGERSLTIYVPLISDAVPEPDERFFVNFRDDPETGEGSEAVLRVEVVVTDDDS